MSHAPCSVFPVPPPNLSCSMFHDTGQIMPKKRKKQTSACFTHQGKTYQKYQIEWVDITGESGWLTPQELENFNMARPVTTAWLYSMNDKEIRLFSTYDIDNETKEIAFADNGVYPRGCILKMKRLKE